MAHASEILTLREIPDTSSEQLPKLNVTFSHGTETGGNSITTTIQVYDKQDALARHTLLRVWYAATANGVPDATGNTVTAAGTGAIIETVTANAQYIVETNSSGVVTMANVVAGAATRYLNVALPDGEVIASSVITWAA